MTVYEEITNVTCMTADRLPTQEEMADIVISTLESGFADNVHAGSTIESLDLDSPMRAQVVFEVQQRLQKSGAELAISITERTPVVNTAKTVGDLVTALLAKTQLQTEEATA